MRLADGTVLQASASQLLSVSHLLAENTRLEERLSWLERKCAANDVSHAQEVRGRLMRVCTAAYRGRYTFRKGSVSTCCSTAQRSLAGFGLVLLSAYMALVH